jgi:hypothetical protein
VTRGSRGRSFVASLLIVFGLIAVGGPLEIDGIAGKAAALTGCTRTASSASSLQYLINKVAAGSTICLTANVRSSSPITIRRSNIRINGRGYKLQGIGYHAVLETRCASNVTIRDLTVSGDHERPGYYIAGREHAHGVAIHGGSNIRIHRVRSWYAQGDGFYLAHCNGRWVNGVHVTDSSVAWNGRQGIAVVGARNVRFERMTFKNIAWHVIDVEPDWNVSIREGAENVIFDGGTSYGWIGKQSGSTGTAMLYIGTPYGAVSGRLQPSINGVHVRNYRVVDAPTGIWSSIEPNGGYTVRNVTFVGNRGAGRWWTASRGVITCRDTDGFTVNNNNQAVTYGQGMYMARSVGCANASASGNTGSGLAGQIRH